MRFYRIFAFVFTSVATGLAAAFIFLLMRPEIFAPPAPTQPQVIQEQPRTPVAATPGPASYADAVAMTAPSVVNIFTTKLTREKSNPLMDDPVLKYFFGPSLKKPKVRRENSLGSGVIIDANGYILTNNHVISGASEIRVVLHDGRQVPARLMGADPETDLAVLQAAGDNFPVAKLGNSIDLQVGDVVLAIGNPFAVGKTVTMGIVSATGRNQLGITNYENFIQTDAAINPGNSGGALINAHGEVVGINTAIFSKSGGSQGIGFAIPVSLAKNVMQQIIEKGKVVRGWLGITGQNLTPALAESLVLDDTSGVLVSGVLEDGPADKAGMQPGDVILAINNSPIRNSQEIMSYIAGVEPNNLIKLEVYREGRKVILLAEVQERPAMKETP